jgi:hypothetical protein
VDQGLLLFPSTHQALAAEDALRRAGIDLRVIPAPQEYTSGCGLAIRVAARDFVAACEVLTTRAVRFVGRPGAG